MDAQVAGDANRLLARLDEALPQSLREDAPGAMLDELDRQLRRPLRVAVVGQIKAGKSSLLNAVLGRRLLPTGTTEATYNVTWLRHGETEGAVVRWRDGRLPLAISLSELEEWTRRREMPQSLDDVAFVDVYSPLELLRDVELIDTPGLGSTYETDSRNTSSFLRIAEAVSLEEASQADAAIYLFRRGVHDSDQAALHGFHHRAMGRVSPVNTLGVLTQYDRYWPAAGDPRGAAAGVVQALRSQVALRRLIYNMVPVASLLARPDAPTAAAILRLLPRLCAMPDAEFASLTSNVRRFIRGFPEGSLTGEGRMLVDTLGLYGIVRLRALALESGPEAALSRLHEESGIEDIRHYLVRHFQRNALLIKLTSAMPRLRVAAAGMRDRGNEDLRRAGMAWLTLLDRFVAAVPQFLRLQLARAVAIAPGDLSQAEIDEVIGAAMEGRTDQERHESDGPEQLARRVDYWRARLNEARHVCPDTEPIARLMCRLLEQDLAARAN